MPKKTAAQIKKEFQALTLDMLPGFLKCYGDDERASVKKLVVRASKRLAELEKERERIYRLGKYERQYGKQYAVVCGVDEAGRGPLAGPVVAGAVILPKDCEILYINDSKQLSEKKREELYDVIMREAVATGIGVASPQRIDEVNILNATYEAMREAINNLGTKPDILLNDAVTIPQMPIAQVPIVKGDAKSISIGAASILAKVTRDRMMLEYEDKYPGYGFASNKGYGTQAHIAAIKQLGPVEIHRRTFIRHFPSTEE